MIDIHENLGVRSCAFGLQLGEEVMCIENPRCLVWTNGLAWVCAPRIGKRIGGEDER